MPVPPTISGLAPDELTDAARIIKAPNSRFWLAHDPSGGWEVGKVDGKSHILPVFGQFFLTAGISMVHVLKEGQPQTAAWQEAVQVQRAAGITMLDPATPVPDEFLPKALQGRRQGFLGFYPCHWPRTGRTGNFHCLVWESPANGLPNQETRMALDVERYNAWRLHLRTSGQVQPVFEPAIAQLARATTSAVERIKNRAGLSGEERASYLTKPAQRALDFQAALKNLEAEARA